MKKILIIGLIFVLVGGVFCGAAYAAGERYADLGVTNVAAIFFAEDGVAKINIGAHVGDVKILKSERNSGDIYVEAENVGETGFVCEQSGDTLNISYNPKKFGFVPLPDFIIRPFWSAKAPVITIYVPEGTSLEEVYFDGGVGNTEVRQIQTKSFVINGGLGNFDVKDIYSENLKIDGGVGNIKIAGTIAGDVKINGGLGNVRLNLRGEAEDYKIKVNGGLGDIRVNGNNPKDSKTGKYSMKIDGGVGNIDIIIN